MSILPLPAVKTCQDCRQSLPLSEFNRRTVSPDGRNARCRACDRSHQSTLKVKGPETAPREKVTPGQQVGYWTVLSHYFLRVTEAGKQHWFVTCRCRCGTVRDLNVHTFLRKSLSCGCRRAAEVIPWKNVTPKAASVTVGSRFGRWAVTGPLITRKRGEPGDRKAVLCRCDCGAEREVAVYALTSGFSLSCGCLTVDRTRETHTTHGATPKGQKTRLYGIWVGMRGRCGNPNDTKYYRYGGRGITVCEEWQTDFAAFRDWALAHGYADDLEIDRAENDLGYHPDNCRWVTRRVNANNTSRNFILEAWGEEKTLKDWTRDPRCRVPYDTLRSRIVRHFWEPERAISQPPIQTARWYYTGPKASPYR